VKEKEEEEEKKEEKEVMSEDFIRLTSEYRIFTYAFLVSNQSRKNWGKFNFYGNVRCIVYT
jgi:hypothetical protein